MHYRDMTYPLKSFNNHLFAHINACYHLQVLDMGLKFVKFWIQQGVHKRYCVVEMRLCALCNKTRKTLGHNSQKFLLKVESEIS